MPRFDRISDPQVAADRLVAAWLGGDRAAAAKLTTSRSVDERLVSERPPAKRPAVLPCRLVDLGLYLCSYPLGEPTELNICGGSCVRLGGSAQLALTRARQPSWRGGASCGGRADAFTWWTGTGQSVAAGSGWRSSAWPVCWGQPAPAPTARRPPGRRRRRPGRTTGPRRAGRRPGHQGPRVLSPGPQRPRGPPWLSGVRALLAGRHRRRRSRRPLGHQECCLGAGRHRPPGPAPAEPGPDGRGAVGRASPGQGTRGSARSPSSSC
jgi:hypothetical protein